MSYLHEQKRIGDYLIKVFQDDSPESPRTWDNLGTMACFHPRYDLGDDNNYCQGNYDSWDEMEEDIIEKENVHTILPLYLYDHSGITISTSPFGCQWDSMKIGFIFVSKDKVEKECGEGCNVEEVLKGEVETYDQFIRGDVYGFRICKVTTCDHGHEHEEELDSCWGFYGDEECMTEAEGVLKYHQEDSVSV